MRKRTVLENAQTELHDSGLPAALSQIIAENVWLLKKRGKVTQTELASAMHLTQSTLSLKLGGKVKWNSDDLAYLSAFFNVSVAYLVTNNVTMPSDHYQLRTQYAVDNAIPSQELAGAAGPRYIARPDDGAENTKKRGANNSPRAIVMPYDPDFLVPSVGLEPTLRRF
jgi:transcriptional regulator with XRE-family HTH domain